MLRPAIITLFLLAFQLSSFAQATDSTEVADADFLIGLSLDDLLKVKIVSASRQEENSFDVPTSSYVITGEEIKLMGATSIPDALKICPGLIVREVSNGNYDVSIRGGIDGFPAYNYTYTNTTILVMINNRPVFSSLEGGTFWQNLPIGIAEIKKIEIVNGPSSPLYGPNAVSGVINIITNTYTEVGTYASGTFQTDFNNPLVSIEVAEVVSDKFSVDFAINYENRARSNTDFYDPKTETYRVIDSVLSNKSIEEIDARMLDKKKSLLRFSGGFNFHYTPKKDVNFSLSMNRNSSIGLVGLAANTTLSKYTNTSQSALLQGQIKNLSFSISQLRGEQGLTGALSYNKYNYQNHDSYIDYAIILFNKRLSLKPALSYQIAEVDDREFTTEVGRNGTFDGYGHINNIAPSIKADLKVLKKLRLITAIRYDKFNHTNRGFYSWQGIVNYKPHKNHLLRFVSGSSNSGAFLVPTLINNTNPIAPSLDLIILGNKNLNLLNNTSYEVGYRAKANDITTFDISFFTQRFSNFYRPIRKKPSFNPTTGHIELLYVNENLDLQVEQKGITASLQTNLADSKLQLRPHITFQKTTTKNYSPYYNEKGAFDQPGYSLEGHKDTTYELTEKFTPTFWGGLNIIAKPTEKLLIDLSCYFYDNYTLHMGSETDYFTGEIKSQKGSSIKSKLQINIKGTYNFTNTFSMFLNLRNITNQTAAEGFGSDRLSSLYMIGAHLSY